MSAPAACPACTTGNAGAKIAADAAGDMLVLSLPGIHCAGCIAGVEGVLAQTPGVRAARVNLGRRHVRVTTEPELGAAPIMAALTEAGYEAHELDEAALAPRDAGGTLLLARIAVAGFAMMNVMALSVAVWSGAGEATRALFHWVAAAIALPALAFAAVPFFTSAWSALRVGRLNMDVPIALAIALAALSSLIEAIADSGAETWFDAALSLTFFLLAGRYLDHRARAAARSAAAELTALELPRATLLDGKTRRSIDVAEIVPGDRLALSAGARAPVDGTSETAALVDRSALTGEAQPVALAAGDDVLAGDTLIGAPIVLKATARAEDSTLRRLAALVEVAEGARHKHSGIADFAARLYAPVVHGLSALAFLGWWLGTGDVAHAIGVAIAVLIITCPCALGLAVPAVTASMTGRLFRAGVLVKSDTALERLAQIDCVLFDKTGTLTEGVAELPALDEGTARVALALAQASDHPVARAIAGALHGVDPAQVTAIREEAGQGMHGDWQGVPVFLGRGANGTELRIGESITPLPLQERLRPGAREAVTALLDQGIEVHLVTGDRPEAADALADRLGISNVHARIRPEGKAALVDHLGEQGARVLMVGDGLNDTAALASAHASMAPASALDAARVASDAVLLGRDLQSVPDTLALARRAMRRIKQNLCIAAGYNCVAIPICLAGFATPLMAALAMSSSSITVVLNAVRK